MVQCCFYGCFSSGRKKGNLKFYSFPKDTTLRKQWLHRSGRDKTLNLVNAKVCSLHFSEIQFKRDLCYELTGLKSGCRVRNLTPEALPDLLLPVIYHGDGDVEYCSTSKGALQPLTPQQSCHGSASNDRKKGLKSKAKSQPIIIKKKIPQNATVCNASARSGIIRAAVPESISPAEVLLPATAVENNQTMVHLFATPHELMMSQLQEQPKESVCQASSNDPASPLSAVRDDSCTLDGVLPQPTEMSDLDTTFKCKSEATVMPLEVCLKIKPEVVDESFEYKEYVTAGTTVMEKVVVKEEEAPTEDGSVKNELNASIVPDSQVLNNEDCSIPCLTQDKLIKIEIINDGALEESLPSSNPSDESIPSKDEREISPSVEASHTGHDLLNSKYSSKTAVSALSKSSYHLVPYVLLTRLLPNVVHHYHEGSQANCMRVSCDGENDGAKSVYVRGPRKTAKRRRKNNLKKQLTAIKTSKKNDCSRSEATDKRKPLKKLRYKKIPLHLQRRAKKVLLPGYVPCGHSVQQQEMAGDDSNTQFQCITSDAPKKILNNSKRRRKIFAGFEDESCDVSNEVVIEKQLTGAIAVEKQVLDGIASLVLPHSIFDSGMEDIKALPGHKMVCHLCKYASRAPLAMQYHMKMHTVNEDTLSFCAQCDYITNKEEFLCLHFKVHDFNRRISNDEDGADASCNKLKLCCFCHFVNYDEQSMNIHAFQEHPHENFKLIFRYERFYSNASQKFAWRYEGDDPVLLRYPPVKGTERCSSFKNVRGSTFYNCQGLLNDSDTANGLTISHGDKEKVCESTKPLPVPIHSRFRPNRRVSTTALQFLDAKTAEETSTSSLFLVNQLNYINKRKSSATTANNIECIYDESVPKQTEGEGTSLSAAASAEVSVVMSEPSTKSKPKLNVLSKSTPARLPPFCSLSHLTLSDLALSPEDVDLFADVAPSSMGKDELERTRSLKNSKLLPLRSISPPLVDRDIIACSKTVFGSDYSHGQLTRTQTVPFSSVNNDDRPEAMTSLSPRVNRECGKASGNRLGIVNIEDILSVKTAASSLPLEASLRSSTGGLPVSFTVRSTVGLKKVTNNALSGCVAKDNKNDYDILEADYPGAMNDTIEDDAFSNGHSLTTEKMPEIAEFSLRVKNGSFSDCKTIKLKKIIVPESIIKFLRK